MIEQRQDVGQPLQQVIESHKKRHSGLIFVKHVLNWGKQDGYFELTKFKMEILNILQTKAYGLAWRFLILFYLM